MKSRHCICVWYGMRLELTAFKTLPFLLLLMTNIVFFGLLLLKCTQTQTFIKLHFVDQDANKTIIH